MSDNFRERFGNGAGIREIPPTTIEGRVTALECRITSMPAPKERFQESSRLDELEHKVATLERMFERTLELMIAGKV